MKQSKLQPKTGRRGRRRQGAAAVEMSIVLPLIGLIVFGAIDSSNALSAKQTLTSAAYEGARRAIRVDGSAEDVNSFVGDFLTEAGISGATTTISPSEPASVAPGTQISVNVAVNASNVSLMPWTLLQSQSISSTVVMVKE